MRHWKFGLWSGVAREHPAPGSVDGAAPGDGHADAVLLGHIPALKGLLVVLLLIAAAFVANVLAGVIALLMLRDKA